MGLLAGRHSYERGKASPRQGAAMSMARLWRDQGKRDEARDLLAPIGASPPTSPKLPELL